MPRPCYAAMQLCGGGKSVKRIVDPQRGMTFVGREGNNFDQTIMGAADATTWQQCGNTHERVSQTSCSDSARHV